MAKLIIHRQRSRPTLREEPVLEPSGKDSVKHPLDVQREETYDFIAGSIRFDVVGNGKGQLGGGPSGQGVALLMSYNTVLQSQEDKPTGENSFQSFSEDKKKGNRAVGAGKGPVGVASPEQGEDPGKRSAARRA